MPAETPCVVTMRPLSTKRASGTTVMRGKLRSFSIEPKCVVARSPSRRPALARTSAPLHTDMVSSAPATRALTHAIILASPYTEAACPPGMTRMSGLGLSAMPYSGVMRTKPWLTIGSCVGPTVNTLNAPLPAAEKTSPGPAKSRSSTPG